MVLNQKNNGRALSMPVGLAYGATVSIAITVLIASILSKLTVSEMLAENNIGYGVMILLLISSFGGSLSAYSKIKHQRMLVCILSGAIYFGILLAVTALFFGGQYNAVGVTAVLIFGGSLTAGLLGLRRGRGGKRTKIRLQNR